MMWKRKIYYLILLKICILYSSLTLQGQNWPKIYGDYFHSLINDLAETYDKGYILTAFTYDIQGIPEYGWIIKTDIDGSILWDKKFGDGNYRNWFSSSKITNDVGIIISGVTSKYSAGDNDPLFLKLNVCGEIEWCKVLPSPDQNYGTGILQLINGSYIGMLQYYGEGETYARISLVKMDQIGEPIWIQRLAQEDTLITNEEGHYLYLTDDSTYLVSGSAYHPGYHPFWIMTDTSGIQVWDLLWYSLLGQAHQVVEKDTGIYYSTSWGIGANEIQSPILLKFDHDGNPLNMYYLMGDTIVAGSSSPITYLNDSILVIGVSWRNVVFPVDQGYSEVFLTDTIGNLINRRVLLDEYHVPDNIIKTFDNKLLVAGNYVVDGNWDIYLWKMNADLEDDTIYTQPLTYDSLCPYPIVSDTIDLDCSLFVNVDEIPTKAEYESSVKIYPNPASNWITLAFPDNLHPGPVEIQLFNGLGQTVIKTKVQPMNRISSLQVSNLSPGLFFIIATDRREQVFRGKFVKGT